MLSPFSDILALMSKIEVEQKKLEQLERKASFLEELLSLIEDKYLGFLMEETEEEESIPLSEAKKLLT